VLTRLLTSTDNLALVPETAEEATYALSQLKSAIRPPFLRVARFIAAAEIDGERNQRWANFYSQYLKARGQNLAQNINHGIPYLRTLTKIPVALSNIVYLDTDK
jgi:hypothetical protein